MIFLFFGQDTYRMQQGIKELAKKSEADLYKLDLEEDGFSKVRLLAGSGSLFSRKKMLVVERANFIQPQELSSFISNFQNREDTIVFWDEKIEPEKLQIFKDSKIKIQEFKNLTGAQLKNWIVEEAKQRGLRLFPAHWERLAVYGSDTWALINELDKMLVEGYGSSFSSHPEGTEGSNEILRSAQNDGVGGAKPGSGPSITYPPTGQAGNLKPTTCFNLGDSFFVSKKQSLNDLLQLSQQGEDEFGLFNYLANHCRTILLTKYYTEKKQPVSADHKIHPYVAKKATAVSRGLALDQLIRKFKNFFEEDFKIKTGLSKPIESLEKILLS